MGALVESGIQRSSCELTLLGRIIQMGDDNVVDVRIALARTLGQMCRKDELYALPQSRSDDLNKLIAKLATDDKFEVSQPVSGILSDDELQQYKPAQSDEMAQRNLVLGPADGGPHRPDGEGGFTNNFIDADGDDGDGHVFPMDDDSNSGDEGAEGKTEEESQLDSEGNKDSSAPPTQAQSAQHLEMSRLNIFGGAKRQAELDFGSDWVNANGPAFFDYGDNDDDDDIEDDDGLEDEPHHLLNVDRDSSGSGELIEDESQTHDAEARQTGAGSHAEADEGNEQESQQADNSMEEEVVDSEHGITLSSPQRGLETAIAGSRDGDTSSDSPSRPSGSPAGGKAADPFLAFVAGRRSQDLSKLQMDLGGRAPASRMAAAKRSRLSNGTAAPQPTLMQKTRMKTMENLCKVLVEREEKR